VAQLLQEFAVFMWLLKSAKKGLPVPAAPLSSAQLRQFAGYSGEAASGRLEYQVSPARFVYRLVQGGRWQSVAVSPALQPVHGSEVCQKPGWLSG
jgi:hypothetical protein